MTKVINSPCAASRAAHPAIRNPEAYFRAWRMAKFGGDFDPIRVAVDAEHVSAKFVFEDGTEVVSSVTSCGENLITVAWPDAMSGVADGTEVSLTVTRTEGEMEYVSMPKTATGGGSKSCLPPPSAARKFAIGCASTPMKHSAAVADRTMT